MDTNKPTAGELQIIPEPLNSKQSRIITKVLSPAVRLWLRSQLSQVSHLEVKISGGDRQILSGYIPHVSILARQAVYQGLHLSHVQLVGENIRINLNQVLTGKPLQLLQPVPIVGELLVQQSDLNASVRSPLLATALTNLLNTLLPIECKVNGEVNWHEVIIECDRLILKANLADHTPLVFQSRLQLASVNELHLDKIQLQMPNKFINLDNFQLNLGSEVAIKELKLSSGQLLCRGSINIIPADV